MLLDGLDAVGPVGAGAGKDDGEAVAMLLGERAEELIDRHAQAARLVEGRSRDLVLGNQQPAIGRNDIDMVGGNRLAVLHLRHRHGRAHAENARKFALMLGIQMNDDDIGGAGIGRQGSEEGLQGMQSSSRGADADDRKPDAPRGSRRAVIVVHREWTRMSAAGNAIESEA